MNRGGMTLFWTLVVFVGGSILFRSLRQATEDSSAAVTVLVQLGALAVVIGAVVIVVRRLR
jgi:DMSO reductase anchor subunit